MWVEPLKKSDIIPANRRDTFIHQVFSNTIEIRNVSNKLALALTARQSNHPIVSHVSDIMEAFIRELDPFIYYGARQHRAKYVYEHERYNNPKFAAFAEVYNSKFDYLTYNFLYSEQKEILHLAN